MARKVHYQIDESGSPFLKKAIHHKGGIDLITKQSSFATRATATQGQVQAFLKKHNADNKLKSLVPFYFYYGYLQGINPVFSICQTVLETAWLTYSGCLITPDMKNTAGIKKSDADINKYFQEHPEDKSIGSDHIKACHQTFNRWTESITTQIDHAALYAGLEGFPTTHTYDPRHFDWCFGEGKSIGDFCVHYSTDEYSTKIVNYMNECENTKDDGTTVTIDADIAQDMVSMMNELSTYFGVPLQSNEESATKASLEKIQKKYEQLNRQYNAFYSGYLTLLNQREQLRKAAEKAINSSNTANAYLSEALKNTDKI